MMAAAENIADLRSILSIVAEETGALKMEDADEDSVGWTTEGPLPMTFGHVRRAHAALAALEAALPAAEPVAWMDNGDTRNGSTSTSFRVVTAETKAAMPKASADNFNTPLYAAPLAPFLAVKALDFDTVYVIPREMTDEEWSEVKYNVDRKANPDIDLWRIKEAVKYANFVAGHRGRSALSAQVQDVAGSPLREVFERWRDGYGFNEDSDEDVALLERAAAPAKQEG